MVVIDLNVSLSDFFKLKSIDWEVDESLLSNKYILLLTEEFEPDSTIMKGKKGEKMGTFNLFFYLEIF